MNDHLRSYSASQRELIRDRCDELSGLIELVSMLPEITLQVGPPHSQWSFQFERALVSAPVNDLLDASADYCRGLALHEAAHATITRLFDLLNPRVAQDPAYHLLFNVIEDCRIETWMMERSPGARPWIQEYNARLFTPLLNQTGVRSLSTQFLNAILSEWWFQALPFELDDQVSNALEETREAVRRAIAAYPPRHVVNSGAYLLLYQRNQTLSKAYLRSDRIQPPSPFECLVRMRQLQMLHEVVRGVMPAYEQLLLLDQQSGLSRQHPQEFKQMLEELRADHLNQSSGQCRANQVDTSDTSSQGSLLSSRALNLSQASLSSEEMRAAQQNQQNQQNQQDQQNQLSSQRLSSDELRAQIRRALDIDSSDLYLKVWRQLYREIDALSEALLEVLTKRSKPQWIRGLSSGSRIDLREAMAFEADPRRYQHLWMKQKRPEKIDPAIIVHLDISASMEGSRITEAFKGLVLLTEVCARLTIPLEVICFNQQATLVRAWDEPLEVDQRRKLGRLLKRVNGGTLYAKALNLTRQRLKTLPFRDRFLIAISDGEPQDGSEVRRGISSLMDEGVDCIGLGIGSDTSNLKRFFSQGLYEVTPAEVARELAGILDQLLR